MGQAKTVPEAAQADNLQGLTGARRDISFGYAAHTQGKGDVLFDRHVRE
jgi:hypothetical protein